MTEQTPPPGTTGEHAKLSGGCLCGAVQYQIDGIIDPQLHLTCFCRDCQQVTGTGHARSLGLDKQFVTWQGRPKIYLITAKSGNTVESAFCQDCGAPLYKTTSAAEHLIFFHAGSLSEEDIDYFQPAQDIWTESRVCWDTLSHLRV